MVRRPAAVAAQDACTLPATWCTVEDVFRRSVLQGRQRFLLHAATGGVGIVAMEYLGWLGVHIYASVGQPHKHELAHSLGAVASFSSRNASAFVCGMLNSLARGRAHAACNSLIADFVAASIAMLGMNTEGSNVAVDVS